MNWHLTGVFVSLVQVQRLSRMNFAVISFAILVTAHLSHSFPGKLYQQMTFFIFPAVSTREINHVDELHITYYLFDETTSVSLAFAYLRNLYIMC